jgi:filamentous hemagglutinin
VAVTVGSGAAAVGTSPTVVGSAVSAGSAINAGGKVVSAVGVAGDAVSTIIANNSGGSSGATRQLMFGANGVKVNSKTVWKGDNGIRLDVENPNPGQRPGQIHLQDAKGGKYMFDPDTVTFSDAPNWVNKLLKDSDFVKGMNKGLEKYLGEQGI